MHGGLRLQLVACHNDLIVAFWSLILPPRLQGSFRVLIEGPIYAFYCLPFGWQHSPIICQIVLASILEIVPTNSGPTGH